MRILIYNFLQPEDGGGGVGVYSTNLAKGLRDAGHEVITLSAGDVYGFARRSPQLKTWHDGFSRAVIVNSPMIAPAHAAWDDFGTYTESSGLDGIPALLRERYKSIDVFHFQNIEGLTSSFFVALRAEFPASKMIYSVHNYGAVCPQVDLWFQEREVCVDYRDGLNCTRCFAARESSGVLRSARRRRPIVQAVNRHAPGIVKLRRSLGGRIVGQPAEAGATAAAHASETEGQHNAPLNAFEDVDNEGPVLSFPDTDGDGTPYARFRQANIEICASVFDHVLAVSERTRQVFLARGPWPGNVAVSYIGTAHKALFDRARKITDTGGRLHIGYLGYMRRNKGFYLLLQALEALPDEIARDISLTVAAKRAEDPAAHGRLTRLASRFAEFRYHDGFTHRTLDAVLDGVNLGIVPPIWEDNLPQVAIEMVSRGIPILTSDRGGAQEIAGNPRFVFEGGSGEALQERIRQFSTGETPLSDFWDGQIRIYSIEQHIGDLAQYYGLVDAAEVRTALPVTDRHKQAWGAASNPAGVAPRG